MIFRRRPQWEEVKRCAQLLGCGPGFQSIPAFYSGILVSSVTEDLKMCVEQGHAASSDATPTQCRISLPLLNHRST